jgi:uncharacterized protein YjbJ (UPF0337 family)
MKRAMIEGTFIYWAGKLQESYGRLIDDRTHQFEGIARQIEGKLQRSGPARRRTALVNASRCLDARR